MTWAGTAAAGAAMASAATNPRTRWPAAATGVPPSPVPPEGLGASGRLRAVDGEPLLAVGAHRLDDRPDVPTLRGEPVLDSGGCFGVDLARDDALFLEDAQPLRERPGLIPASDRSSCVKRHGPAARSRRIRSVHFPETIRAVASTGQSAAEAWSATQSACTRCDATACSRVPRSGAERRRYDCVTAEGTSTASPRRACPASSMSLKSCGLDAERIASSIVIRPALTWPNSDWSKVCMP